MHAVFIAQKNQVLLNLILQSPVWSNQSDFFIADTALDGHTAMNLLVKNHYDLVIIDIHLPEMDGFTLLTYFKECASTMLFVITSEFSNHAYTRQALHLGAFDYLITPILAEDLDALLQRVDSIYHYTSYIDVVSDHWANTISITPNVYALIAARTPPFTTVFQNYIDNYLSTSALHKKNQTQITSFFNATIHWFFEGIPYLKNFINIHKSVTFHSLLQHYEMDANVHYYTIQLSAFIEFILLLHPYHSDSTIHSVFDYMVTNIDKDISQKTLAKKFFLTNAAFSKSFLQKTKLHFNDYVISIKLLRAEYLLLNSDLLIYEVGNAIGYKDYNYFVRLFKHKYEKTPSEFRRSFLRVQ